jgi:SAM-dependent methyltransferase
MRWPIVMRGGPASRANAQRNARGTPARLERWTPARDALWAVLDRYVADGARVAVVGAGNGHDVPLRRLAGRAARVDLIDLDARAARAARGRLPGDLRGHVEVVREDVTAGVADELVRKAAAGAIPDVREAPAMPLGAGRYDVVVGVVLARIDRPLVASVVRRLHLSAPGGVVVHVHDPLGWWADHPQPVALEAILAAAQAGDLAAAHELVAQGRGPTACDPLAIALEAGIEPVETVFWRWPFQEGVDYLARATVTRPGGASLH